jgi:hypothetical protein
MSFFNTLGLSNEPRRFADGGTSVLLYFPVLVVGFNTVCDEADALKKSLVPLKHATMIENVKQALENNDSVKQLNPTGIPSQSTISKIPLNPRIIPWWRQQCTVPRLASRAFFQANSERHLPSPPNKDPPSCHYKQLRSNSSKAHSNWSQQFTKHHSEWLSQCADHFSSPVL